MNNRKSPLALAVLAACSLPALAEEQAPAPAVLDEVTVVGTAETPKDFQVTRSSTATRTDTDLRDVPQTVAVVNQAVMQSQGVSTLREALRNVAGITFSAGEGGAIGDSINLRGFSARTDVFLDGFRDRSQTTRDTFFLESVEVLKGPSSMTFGRGTTGGVINQVSKKPEKTAFTEVGVSVGTEALYRATVDINQPLSETAALRLNLMGHRAESTRDIVENQRWGVAPSLRFGIGQTLEVTFDYLHQEANDIPDYGLPFYNGRPLNVDKDKFYGLAGDWHDQVTDNATVRVQAKLSPTLTLRNSTQFGRSEVAAAPSVPKTDNGSVIKRERKDRVLDDSSLYNQTELVAKFATGGVKHVLLTGVEVGQEESDRVTFTGQTIPNTSASSPDPYATPTGARKVDKSTDADADSVAVYVQDQLALTEQWKLIAGLRHDRFAADMKETAANGAVTRREHTDKMLSQRAGVIYQPSETDSYYLSYGTSFNPSAEALSLSDKNQALDPEENRSYELGAKWLLLDGALGVNTAAFRIEKTNMRTPSTFGGTDEVLDGEARVDGVELELNGRVNEHVQLLASAVHMNPEISKSRATQNATINGATVAVPLQGKDPANSPHHAASFWTTYTLGAWEFGAGANYVGARFGNNANTNKVDGDTRIDATVAYVQPSWELRMNGKNLSDAYNFDQVSGRAVPAAGRQWQLSGRYKF